VEGFLPNPPLEPSTRLGSVVLLLIAGFEAARLTLFPLFLCAVARSLNAPGIAGHALLLAAMTPVFLFSGFLFSYAALSLEAPSNNPVPPSDPFLVPGVLALLFNLGGGALLLAWGALVLYLTRRLLMLRLAAARKAIRDAQ
jgi:hypothetical protein